MKVYVLLFHDVWDVSYGEPEGGPKDVSIEGIFTSYAAAELASQARLVPLSEDGGADQEPDVREFFTIEEHELVQPEPAYPDAAAQASVNWLLRRQAGLH